MRRLRDWQLTLGSIWHLPTALAVGLMLFLVAKFSQDPFNLEQGSGKRVEARITYLSSMGNRYQGRWPGLRVSAQTKDGAIGETTALPEDLKNCKVGDLIDAHQAGLKLYLEPRPCD